MHCQNANAPKVNQASSHSTTKTLTHTHTWTNTHTDPPPPLMNLPGVLALKKAGKAEGLTDSINPGWYKTMKTKTCCGCQHMKEQQWSRAASHPGAQPRYSPSDERHQGPLRLTWTYARSTCWEAAGQTCRGETMVSARSKSISK